MITVLDIKLQTNAVYIIHPVIVQDGTDMVLIDAGCPNQLELFEAEAEKKGIDLSKLTQIIITHHDHDHIGSLAALRRKYPNLKVSASQLEADCITKKTKGLRLQQAEQLYDSLPDADKPYAMAFQKMLEGIEYADVDTIVKGGDVLPICGGIEIVATPGHTADHISVYIRASKTLVAGDALIVENGKLEHTNPHFALDLEQAKESIRNLRNYDIEQIVCYHGGLFANDCKGALEQLAQQ